MYFHICARSPFPSLTHTQADALLDEVRKLFKKYPFYVDEHAVEIIDGGDEGLFGWVTVNYLLKAIGSQPQVRCVD